MSGPKVVDVRAVRAIQERAWKVLRHRLEKELIELRALCGSDSSEAELQALAAFEISLQRLRSEHLQCSLPQLLDSLLDQADAQLSLAVELRTRIEQARLDKLAAEQAKSRSRHLAVSSLVSRLEVSQLYELRDQLSSDPTDENINYALECLAKQEKQQSASDLQSTINTVAGNSTSTTFVQWLAAHGQQDDPVVVRLDKLAASIELISGIENASSWRERISAIAQVPDNAQRRLQADSIAIQLSDERKRLQRLRDRRRQLDELEAELAAFDDAAEYLRQRVASTRKDESESIDELKSEVHKWCAEEAKREDQAQCQQAILSVLRSLGYDVRDSMATAWAENGNVVVQDSSRQDYGVELCTLAGGHLRTQLVRFAGQSDTNEKQKQRDTEVETQWCQSHTKVLNALNQQGFSPEILAARAAGSIPVKVLRSPSKDNAIASQATSQHFRQQKLP
jgi:hypothetical protein